MNDSFTTLAVFENSTEAHLVKAKLDSEGFKTMLMDERTIDSDPLISQAVGGVKLQVHNNDLEKALKIYNEIRTYNKDENKKDIHCINCNSTRILTATAQRKNIFYMLFPFFEKTRKQCTVCNTIF